MSNLQKCHNLWKWLHRQILDIIVKYARFFKHIERSLSLEYFRRASQNVWAKHFEWNSITMHRINSFNQIEPYPCQVKGQYIQQRAVYLCFTHLLPLSTIFHANLFNVQCGLASPRLIPSVLALSLSNHSLCQTMFTFYFGQTDVYVTMEWPQIYFTD